MDNARDIPRHVRVKGRNTRGFVEFEFSVGDPELYLDMILTPAAFREFCRENRVRFLCARPGGGQRESFGEEH